MVRGMNPSRLPRRGQAEGLSGRGRVWVLTCVVAAAALALTIAGRDLPVVYPQLQLRWWHLAIAFYVSELTVVHMRFRRDAHSFSMSELPLIAGLFLAAPLELVIGQLISNIFVLTLNRRQPPLKLCFNLAQFALQTTLAVTTFRVIAATGDPLGPAGWLASVVAALTALTVADILINAAIKLTGGTLQREDILEVFALSAFAATMNTGLAVIGITLLIRAPSTAALALVPPVVLFMAYRAYISQRHERARLASLYDATRDLHQSPQIESALVAAARHACAMLEAEFAEIIVFPAGRDRSAYRTAVGPGDRLEVMIPVDADQKPAAFEAVATTGRGVLLPKVCEMPLDHEPTITDGIAAPLTDNEEILGVFLVANKLGNVSSFAADDLNILMTLAGQVSVSLRNGRLEDSLAALTELKEELRYQALHDSLTMLANRTLFREKVQRAIDRCRDGERFAAVVFLDLDDFKVVNDSLGHAAGDQMLIAVAGRLKSACRPGDTVARLGGDEFAILVEDILAHSEAIAVAERIIEKLRDVFAIEGKKMHTRASVGIAFAEDGEDPDQILRNADAAMYAAKRNGKGTYQIFQSSMHAEATRRLQLRHDLREALARDELTLSYQPIIDLATGKITTLESLVRWSHPERGDIPPAQFIPFAEEFGFIAQIGSWVLRQACRHARAWGDGNPGDDEPVKVAVNLSPAQLLSEGLVDQVRSILLEEGVDADRIIFEITETVMMQTSIRKLKELKELGVRLAIDDFGTGYSSLSYLDRLPVDIVKVDRSFTARLAVGKEVPQLVRTVVQLGEALGLETVVEGIETVDQYRRIKELGCQRGQGFLFAEPTSAESVGQLLREQRRGSALFRVPDEPPGSGHLRVVG